MEKCHCADTGWVCECHPEQPWAGISLDPTACNCGGAGMPCRKCNMDLSKSGFEGGVIICSVDEIPDGQRMH